MKIGNEININQTGYKQIQTSARTEEKPATIQDQISLGSSAENVKSGSLAKPETNLSTPENKPAQTCCEPSALAASSVPGPAAAVVSTLSKDDLKKILENLESDKVAFFQERNLHIPVLMGKFKSIDADETAKILTEGSAEDKQRLKVQTQSDIKMPIFDEGDVKELEAFHITGNTASIPHPELAGFINDSIVSGLEFKTPDSENIGAYGAYNILTGGWPGQTENSSAVELNRNGVAILSLNKEKVSDPLRLKQDFKEAWNAYNELEKNPQSLKLVSKEQSGTSFAERANIHARLLKSEFSPDNADNVYSVIAKRTDSGEKFADVANIFFDMQGKLGGKTNTLETLQAFNYARVNLKSNPRLEKSFIEFYKNTLDINESIKGLRVMTTPVADESFDTREKALISLAETAGKNAVSAYETVVQFLKPGDSLQQAAEDFSSLMKLKNNSVQDTSHTQRAYEYIKTKLADSAEETQAFKDIYKQLGDVEKTVELIETLKKPAGDSTFSERSELMANILKHVYVNFANDSFTFVTRNTLPGEKFADNAKLFSDLLEAMDNTYETLDVASNAYFYTKQDLKGDPVETQSMVKFIKAGKRLTPAKAAIARARTDVPGSDYNNRTDALAKIINYPLFEEAYVIMSSSLFPGETVSQGADQLVAVHKACNNNTTGDIKKTADKLAEMKQKYSSDHSEFNKYINFIDKFKEMNLADEAMKTVKQPVKSESYDDRVKIQDELLNIEAQAKGTPSDAFEDYKTITSKLAPEETLTEAAQRFKSLMNMLRNEKSGATARDAFTFIADEVAKGTFLGKTTAEVTKDLIKELLISDNLKDAKEQLIHNAAPQTGGNGKNTISQDDEYVIIGGIKLKKKKTE
ncbi:MAG: hypothetical protein LWY06_11520 [Firmicutes bacterium]|nr:hypothetical protein [Bacillota bacterium]